MYQRFGDFIETYESPAELQKKIADLEGKLKAAELARDKAEVAKKKAEVSNNSLITALDEEREKRAQEEQSSKVAIDTAGATAVEAFRKSESFIRDLGELTRPSFMFGYTSAMNEAASFLSPEQLESLQSASHYNEDAKELCDRVGEGIQAGKDLAEVRAESNKWLQEFELDGDSAEGDQAGGGEEEQQDAGQQDAEAGGETLGGQDPRAGGA